MGRGRLGDFGCYEFVMHPDGITWHDTNEYCVDQGTSLLATESGEENNKIKTHLLQNEGKRRKFFHIKFEK